jgi:O-antigen ligase
VRRRLPAPAALAAGLVVLGVVAGVLAQSAVVGRLLGTSLHDVSWEARRQVARLTLDLWLRFPLLGSGLGTFRDAFTRLEPAELAGDAWHHAHQDYLELAATGGLVAVALLAVGLVTLVRRLWRVLGSGYRSEDRAAALAALGALAAAAVHEAFDFGLLLPANAFVLVAVCGAAAGARVRERSAPSS